MDVGGLIYGYTVFIAPCCCTCDGRIFGGGYGRNDCEKIRFYDAIKVGLFFGVFQFLMPCIGNLVSGLRLILWNILTIGLRLCFWDFGTAYDMGVTLRTGNTEKSFKNSSLLLAAIATSIDALAAGLRLRRLIRRFCFLPRLSELQHFCFRSAVFLSVRSSAVFRLKGRMYRRNYSYINRYKNTCRAFILTKFAKWDIMIFRAVEILSAGSMICT